MARRRATDALARIYQASFTTRSEDFKKDADRDDIPYNPVTKGKGTVSITKEVFKLRRQTTSEARNAKKRQPEMR